MTSTDASSTTELPTTTQQWVLASRPTGLPTDENFRLETVDLPELNDGDILVANSVATVDPYMRGRMNDTKSYVPPFQLDQPMTGGAVGTVLASKSDKFQVGDAVRHSYGWQTNAVIADSEATPVDLNVAPAAAHLGILGLTGLTAYVGLTAVGEMKEGDVVFISGAAGAVGSAAGQFAKQMGAARVIGSAGSDEKVERLLELGFDAAFNYNDGPVAEQLAKAAPEGIDFYFDNVGGDHLEAAIGAMRTFGRVAMCGAISQYNTLELRPDHVTWLWRLASALLCAASSWASTCTWQVNSRSEWLRRSSAVRSPTMSPLATISRTCQLHSSNCLAEAIPARWS